MEDVISYVLPFLHSHERNIARYASKYVYCRESQAPIEHLECRTLKDRYLLPRSNSIISTTVDLCNVLLHRCTTLTLNDCYMENSYAPKVKRLTLNSAFEKLVLCEIPTTIEFIKIDSCACAYDLSEYRIVLPTSVRTVDAPICIIRHLYLQNHNVQKIIKRTCGNITQELSVGKNRYKDITVCDSYIGANTDTGTFATRFRNCVYAGKPTFSQSMEELEWIDCNAVDADFKSLNLPCLTSLNISDNHALKIVPYFPTLRKLNVIHTQISLEKIESSIQVLHFDLHSSNMDYLKSFLQQALDLEICVKSTINYPQLVRDLQNMDRKDVKALHITFHFSGYFGIWPMAEIRKALPNTLCEFCTCQMCYF